MGLPAKAAIRPRRGKAFYKIFLLLPLILAISAKHENLIFIWRNSDCPPPPEHKQRILILQSRRVLAFFAIAEKRVADIRFFNLLQACIFRYSKPNDPKIINMDKYKLATFICIIWIAISNWGCFQYYYLTNSRKSINDSSLLALQAQDKHFIIYLANGNYFLTNLKVNDSLLNA